MNRGINSIGRTVNAIVEALEGRRLLSGSMYLQGGVLHVAGTSGKDMLYVQRSGPNTNVELSCGDLTGITMNLSTPLAGVRFDGAGGTDSLIVTGQGDGSPLPVSVAGPGGDTLLSEDGGYQIVGGRVTGADQAHAQISVVNGILHVTGTAASDEIYVGVQIDPTKLFVRVDSDWTTFDLAGITGVSVDGGLGDDTIAMDNYRGALHLPATLMGGAGDDAISGPNGRGHADDVTVNLKTPGYMPTTLLGGDGDDTLCGGLDSDQLVGGAGADVFRPLSVSDVIVDPDAADDDATDTGQGGNELPIIPDAAESATSSDAPTVAAPAIVPPGTFAAQTPIKHDGDAVWA
jgi:hypothetical protein